MRVPPDPSPQIQTPEQVGAEAAGTGRLGMWIFLTSLSVFFLGSIVAVIAISYNNPDWRAPGLPGLPGGMWLSTIVMVASSVTMHRAIQAIRRNDPQGLYRGLVQTSVLGGIFLLMQCVNWYLLIRQGLPPTTPSLHIFAFYTLTALHALHVVGGVIPLFIVTARAKQGKYYSFYHPGPEYVALYWHFLDVVWVILFVVLLIVG